MTPPRPGPHQDQREGGGYLRANLAVRVRAEEVGVRDAPADQAPPSSSSEPRLAYARVREGRKSRDGRAARDWARPS